MLEMRPSAVILVTVERPLDEIDADLDRVSTEIMALLQEVAR
jgi:hypothetical protein